MPALIFLGIDVVDLFELHAAWPGAGGGAGDAVIAVKSLNSVNNCRLRCLHEFPQ